MDLLLTDCPYHIVSGGRSKGIYGNGNGNGIFIKDPGGTLNKRRKDGHGGIYYGDSKHVSLSGVLNDADPTTYTRQGKLFKYNDIKFSDWLPECYRILKPKTHAYIMTNPRNLKELQQSAEDAGFQFQNLLIWYKHTQTPNKYYLNAFECILMLRKGGARNINEMGTKNILDVRAKVGNRLHPTEKPVELMEILVRNSTNAGETVMDPFMGAGASGVACLKLNREFIGIEIDEKYYNIAKERIDGETNRE